MTTKNTNKALAQISQKIKDLEWRTIKNVIEIGKFLKEAADQADHGEYMAWLADEFGWSYRTAKRYRDAYAFATDNGHSAEFDSLNLSVSALYLLAEMKSDDNEATPDVRIERIIEAAKQGRVTRKIALAIIEEHSERLEPDPPPANPNPSVEPDPVEPEETQPPDELPAEEAAPPDEKPKPSPDKEPSSQLQAINDAVKLEKALYLLLQFKAADGAWSRSTSSLGRERLRKIIETLQAVYDKYYETSAMKAKADRAEAPRRGHPRP